MSEELNNPHSTIDTDKVETETAPDTTTETAPDTTTETATETTPEVPEINIDEPYLNEQDMSFIDQVYGNQAGEAFDEPEEDRFTTQLKSEIDEIKQLLKGKQEDNLVEEDVDPKYAKLEQQLEALTKELTGRKQQEEIARRNQITQQIEQQNVYVLEQFLSKKIKPTLKLLGADKEDAASKYVQDGIRNELLTMLQEVEVKHLRGRQANPKIVQQVCDMFYKTHLGRLKIGEAKPTTGVPTGMQQKSGDHPDTKVIERQKLETQKQALAQSIDKIMSMPTHERISKGQEVQALHRELRKIIDAEKTLQ